MEYGGGPERFSKNVSVCEEGFPMYMLYGRIGAIPT